jgi:hypothetical protein
MGENNTPLERLWEEFCAAGWPTHAVPRRNASIELVQPKIKLEKVENFRRSKKRHHRTTIHHTITTNPPANYHQKTPEFPEPPSKTPAKQQKMAAHPPQNFNAKFEPKNLSKPQLFPAGFS